MSVSARVADYAAAGVGVSAPAWVTALNTVNVVLGTVSVVLTIAFVVWRWWRTSHATHFDRE